jgi:hypothetical protein
MTGRNPIEALAHLRHEFGEHGGVNMSIEASSTFTVMEPGTMPEMFQGLKGHDAGCYLYGRHFNPTVHNLWLLSLWPAFQSDGSQPGTAIGRARGNRSGVLHGQRHGRNRVGVTRNL